MSKVYQRYLSDYLLEDLKSKILIVTGPRQSGKTTLARHLGLSFDYLNYDERDHHKIFLDKAWDRNKDYIIFDELHKKKDWKLYLKGIYDTEHLNPGIIVTGSSSLDTYKKMGDSLAGRFFEYRLHPLDIKEIVKLKIASPDKALEKLLKFGGFPEPFLKSSPSFYGKWKKSHLDIILKQDLIYMDAVKSLSSVETLVELLRERVGSPISYSSLAEDLNCSPKAVQHRLKILENLYVIFKVSPYHKKISRSLVKAPKYYFYDIAQVKNQALRLENLVACSLLKELNFREDVQGESWKMYYLQNKDKKEIDFLIVKSDKPIAMLEVKQSQDSPVKAFNIFSKHLPPKTKSIQLVSHLKREKTYHNGLQIRKLAQWLSKMDF